MTDDKKIFECSIFDLFNRHGFMEGDYLLPEEEPLVEAACRYLVNQLGIVDQYWQPVIFRSSQHYVKFINVKTQKIIDYYDMNEKDRRKVNAIVDEKNLSSIKVTENLKCYTQSNKPFRIKGTKMTDEELKELVASLAINSKKFDEQLLESSKKFNEQMAELAASQKETDETLKKVSDKLDKVSDLVGNIGRNQGDVAEDFFYNSLIEDTYLGKIHFDDITKNMEKHRGNIQEEDDIVMTNAETIGIVEVKYKAHQNDLQKLERKMRNFKKLFPVYESYKLYGAIASFHINKDAKNEALQRGFFVLERSGKVLHTESGEKLFVL